MISLLHDRHVVNADKIFKRVPSAGAPLTPESSFTEQHLLLEGFVYLYSLNFFIWLYKILDQIFVSTVKHGVSVCQL